MSNSIPTLPLPEVGLNALILNVLGVQYSSETLASATQSFLIQFPCLLQSVWLLQSPRWSHSQPTSPTSSSPTASSANMDSSSTRPNHHPVLSPQPQPHTRAVRSTGPVPRP